MVFRPRILILGGAGMLGHKLWQKLSARFPDTSVTIRKSKSDYARFGSLFQSDRVFEKLDVRDSSAVEKVLIRVQPEVVINCIAITKRHEKPGDLASLIALNSRFPHWLAEWTQKNQSRLIHFSTDCVFDGAQGDYSEKDSPNAQDDYGQTKAAGEVTGERCLTIRSSFIGRELESHTELLDWFLGQRGKAVKGYRQALYTGMTTLRAAALVGDLIEKFPNVQGLRQVASPVINKFDLLSLLNQVFENGSQLTPSDEVICKRNLNGSHFEKETGWKLPPWSNMIEELKADVTPYDQWRKSV